MSQQDHKDFFISYNGADQRWAEWIAWQLEEASYSVILQTQKSACTVLKTSEGGDSSA